jgi:hypothetical protein
MPDASLALSIPPYIEERIRRAAPDGCFVLPHSTPVVAFGNPHLARVATLGLNPSRIEFEVKGVELEGAARRFETLGALGVKRLADAPQGAIERVWLRCNNYFHGNPYSWFRRLEETLSAVGASYFDDTACHLDLTQWATDPTWNGLGRRVQERLVAEDADFLRQQLRAEPISLLLLNGRSVLTAFERVLGGHLRLVGSPVTDGGTTTKIYQADIEGVRVLGWSTNLQSSFGVTRVLRAKLAEQLATLADPSEKAAG